MAYTLDYLELPSTDAVKSRTFFGAAFGWSWRPLAASTAQACRAHGGSASLRTRTTTCASPRCAPATST